MKRTRFFAIFLCLCLLLTACGKGTGEYAADMEMSHSGSPDIAYRDESFAPAENAGEKKPDTGSVSTPLQDDRKLIKTVSIEAETEQYDNTLAVLDSKIAALGGYVESRVTGSNPRSSRWSRMTVRIPADLLTDFLTHMGENTNVLSTSEQTQDVTLQYTDTEARITALRTEQARLLELLSGANNLSEILEIEARLSDVTYELERYEAQKRSYDNRIVYATVTLYIQEVRTLTPVEEPTVWQRISRGFADSWKGVGEDLVDLGVWLIVTLPYLVVWVPLWALALWGLAKLRRKVHKKRQSLPSETP